MRRRYHFFQYHAWKLKVSSNLVINVLQFSRIREFCHDFNIGNFMNRGIPVVFESLVFHVPWNFGEVKTLETSRIVEFHRILRNRIFACRERLEYKLG